MKRTEKELKQHAQIVNTFNSFILIIFGVVFLVFGIQAGMQDYESWTLIGLGVIFTIFGIFRTRMIGRLTKEINNMDEEEFQNLQNRKDEDINSSEK